MVRVPTYSSYMNMLNQTLGIKSQLDLYSFQATTGLKSPTYSGYGMSASSIVSMEASLQVTENFLETNKLLDIQLSTMNTALESINDAVSDFKSMLNSFSGMDVNKLSPDYTGGEITFTSNEDVYDGKTLTVDGVKYTFTDNADVDPDAKTVNVDISGLTPGSDTYAEDVMNALKESIDANYPNSEFKFEGATFTFPLYTINGSSSVLNAAGVETGEPYTMSNDQYQMLQELQTLAFSTMQMLADSLNVSANGKYLFGGGDSSQAPVDFPFSNLEEFQAYYDGVNIQYPDSRAAALSSRSVSYENAGSITLQLTGENTGSITAEKGFLDEAVTGGAATTGNITFDAATNTIKATEYGAFNTLKAGDSIVLGDSGGNDGAYVVKSVSADGKTVTLEESTPLKTDAVLTDGMSTDGAGTQTPLKISTSFPIGTVINMEGFGNNISPQVQVTGISDDGSTLYVRVDPSRFPETAVTFDDSTQWSMNSSSYYQGGDLATEYRISENQTISQDITAENSAFEKLFRALGTIAQGNLVDTSNPADDFEGLINEDHAADIIDEVVQLLQSAVNNNGNSNGETNSDLYTVTAKLSANTVVLNNSDENLTLVKTNLENSIYSVKNVDQTEATVKALMAANNLNASYAVMQTVMNISLLNYLK